MTLMKNDQEVSLLNNCMQFTEPFVPLGCHETIRSAETGSCIIIRARILMLLHPNDQCLPFSVDHIQFGETNGRGRLGDSTDTDDTAFCFP